MFINARDILVELHSGGVFILNRARIETGYFVAKFSSKPGQILKVATNGGNKLKINKNKESKPHQKETFAASVKEVLLGEKPKYYDRFVRKQKKTNFDLVFAVYHFIFYRTHLTT